MRIGPRIEHDAPTHRVPTARLLVAGTMLAGLLAILITRWWTGAGYVPTPLGLPDPGLVTAVGLPVAQFVHEIAGIAVVGLLFLRAVTRCWRWSFIYVDFPTNFAARSPDSAPPPCSA